MAPSCGRSRAVREARLTASARHGARNTISRARADLRIWLACSGSPGDDHVRKSFGSKKMITTASHETRVATTSSSVATLATLAAISCLALAAVARDFCIHRLSQAAHSGTFGSPVRVRKSTRGVLCDPRLDGTGGSLPLPGCLTTGSATQPPNRRQEWLSVLIAFPDNGSQPHPASRRTSRASRATEPCLGTSRGWHLRAQQPSVGDWHPCSISIGEMP
jgi:hypothetical protein